MGICGGTLKQVTIDIWNAILEDEDFESMKDDPSMIRDGNNRERKEDILVETLEAEVVLLIQKRNGQWPKYQPEIHFHQSKDAHREIAKKILAPYRSP